MHRRLPIGAELAREGAWFRVWAPAFASARVVIEAPERRDLALDRERDGHFAGFVRGVGAGARYRFRFGDSPTLYADPASRYQPDGPFGSSQIVDPRDHEWTDAAWHGVPADRHVLYEMHVGTFTRDGTWRAAARHLRYLAELGITTIELMPVAEVAGRHNWGYDGVLLYAPTRNYGTPAELRGFVDAAHAHGLAVILDVVYNHFGPAGCTMYELAPEFRARREPTEWGDAIDFSRAGVREYFIANAAYWIDEFHLDGLRLDSTPAIVDDREPHVITEITRAARAAGRGRTIFIAAENEPQDVRQLELGVDALWNDDFHHSARVALTGVVDGYLHDYRGTPQELVSALSRAYLYQGQVYPWQKKRRGSSTRGIGARHFVHYLENHDQVANIGFGERLVASADPGLVRALTAVLLLGPELPMLFQGQDTGERTPWRYFADHTEPLATAVRGGRAKFVAQFTQLATPEAQARLSDPAAERTFTACILDEAARRLDAPHVQLHRDLLAIRRTMPRDGLAGAVLDAHVFVVRFFGEPDRLLLVNLGSTFAHAGIAEPLVAAPRDARWTLAWSSEDPRYGGHGTPPPFTDERIYLAAHCAVLCAAEDQTAQREVRS